MSARIAYAFREMWASFRRNLTLTAAAILTSAIALLLVGTTLLISARLKTCSCSGRATWR